MNFKTVSKIPPRQLTVCVLLAGIDQLHAQHYPAGSEGIKVGSPPLPGLTVEDENSFYVTVQVLKCDRDTLGDHGAAVGGKLGMKGWPMTSW